jgi:acyl-CoA thioesterase YciA
VRPSLTTFTRVRGVKHAKNGRFCYYDKRLDVPSGPTVVRPRPRLTGRAGRLHSSFMNSYGDPAIRITLLPRDTNPQGTIFGGIILSYIDIAGAVEAHRRTGVERFVTVAMREVIFHQPVYVGDLVSFYAQTLRVGTTSITVRVIVEAERYGGTSERIKVTEAEVVYVAVDANRRKMRINKELVKGLEDIEQHETS